MACIWNCFFYTIRERNLYNTLYVIPLLYAMEISRYTNNHSPGYLFSREIWSVWLFILLSILPTEKSFPKTIVSYRLSTQYLLYCHLFGQDFLRLFICPHKHLLKFNWVIDEYRKLVIVTYSEFNFRSAWINFNSYRKTVYSVCNNIWTKVSIFSYYRQHEIKAMF